ncbi:Tar ligand binding domain-containing protein [Paraburkholderia hiiakae]|uniref:Tar ligand binding domain-containing protein n=1 Tax=Paraburkholderia hiiakae TaxID=1081782 RepID=UPI0038B242D2
MLRRLAREATAVFLQHRPSRSGAILVFARLSISVRLRIAVGVLALLIVAAGVSGLAGMSRTNTALGYAYSNQLAAAINARPHPPAPRRARRGCAPAASR